MKAAKKYGIRVAKIDWIYELGSVVQPSKGDTILDYDYKPYPITTEFICTHPNDLGMEKIAEEIYRTMIGEFSANLE